MEFEKSGFFSLGRLIITNSIMANCSKIAGLPLENPGHATRKGEK